MELCKPNCMDDIISTGSVNAIFTIWQVVLIHKSGNEKLTGNYFMELTLLCPIIFNVMIC